MNNEEVINIEPEYYCGLRMSFVMKDGNTISTGMQEFGFTNDDSTNEKIVQALVSAFQRTFENSSPVNIYDEQSGCNLNFCGADVSRVEFSRLDDDSLIATVVNDRDS